MDARTRALSTTLGIQQKRFIIKFHHYPFLIPGTNFTKSSLLSNESLSLIK